MAGWGADRVADIGALRDAHLDEHLGRQIKDRGKGRGCRVAQGQCGGVQGQPFAHMRIGADKVQFQDRGAVVPAPALGLGKYQADAAGGVQGVNSSR